MSWAAKLSKLRMEDIPYVGRFFDKDPEPPRPEAPPEQPPDLGEARRAVERRRQELEVEQDLLRESEVKRSEKAVQELQQDHLPLGETIFNPQRKEARNQSMYYLGDDVDIDTLNSMERLTDVIGSYGRPRMGVRSWKMQRRGATELSEKITPEAIALGYHKSRQPLTVEQFRVVKEGMTRMGQDITKWIKARATKDANGMWKLDRGMAAAERNELGKMIRQYGMFDYAVRGSTKDAARLLQATQDVHRANIDNETAEEMFDRLGGTAGASKAIDIWMRAQAKGFATQTKTARQIADGNLAGAVYELWRGGLLTGLTTHERNIFGNMTHIVYQELEAWTGALWEAAMKRNMDPINIQTMVGKTMLSPQTWRTMGKAAKAGWRDRTDTQLGVADVPRSMHDRPMETRLDDFQEPAFVQGNVLPERLQGGLLGNAIDEFGKRYVRLPYRFLSSVDEFWKALRYEASITKQSFQEAHRLARAEGLKPGDAGWQDRIDAIAKEFNTDPPQAAHKAAQAEARAAAFQQKGEDSSVVSIAMKARNMRVPGTHWRPLRYVMPFIQTPANILARGAGIFAGPLTPRTFRQLTSMDSAEVASALGRISMSASLWGGVAWLSDGLQVGTDGKIQGLPRLTGGVPPGVDRKALEAAGWQPFSIRIGEKYFSYQAIEPVGMGLALMTIAMDQYRAFFDSTTPADQEKAEAMLNAGMGALADYIQDKSYLQGLANIIQAATYGEESFSKSVAATGGNLLYGFVPNIVKQGQRSLELMNEEEYREVLRQRYAGTPWDVFLNTAHLQDVENIPKSYDHWGRPRVLTGYVAAPMIDPFRTKDIMETRSKNPNLDLDEWLVALQITPSKVGRRHSFPGVYVGTEWKITQGGNPTATTFDLYEIDPRLQGELQKEVGKARKLAVLDMISSNKFKEAKTPQQLSMDIRMYDRMPHLLAEGDFNERSKQALFKKALADGRKQGMQNFLFKNGNLTENGKVIQAYLQRHRPVQPQGVQERAPAPFTL